MVKTFVTAALERSRNLLAKINKITNITTIGKLKQKDPAVAVLLENELRVALYEINQSVANDEDQKWPIDPEELRQLRQYQLLFAQGLKKLTGKNQKIASLN
ncbi:hypothetical protein HYV87_03850 [Candidatus Woesearchaeota archaeon]|nr:hypothetical protein [Candidatus Woesearchaeota archaeon]MBI2582228.1 hypothetical protein [Candidatus Woesearchaeota archaeon]